MTRALILIDIQNDYFIGGRWPVEDMARVSERAAGVLNNARRAGDLVIHIQHEALRADAPFFRPGTAGMQIHQSVPPPRR